MTGGAAAPAAAASDRLYARGVVLVLLAGVAWSTAGLVIRLMEQAGGWQIVFWRSAAMVPTLLLFIALRNRGEVAAAFWRAGWNASVGGLCLAFAFAGFVFALLHTTVANVLFILSAAPLLAAVLGWLILGEPVRRATWTAMIGAVVGVGVMVAGSLERGALLGNLIALLTTFGFAGFTIALRRGRDVDMLPAVCWAGAFSMLIAALAILMTGPALDGFRVSGHDLALCFSLGIVQLSLGLVLYTFGSRHVPAAELALLAMTEVVLGPIWVWLGVGETPSMATLAGGAVVLAAVVFQAIGGARRPRPPIGVT